MVPRTALLACILLLGGAVAGAQQTASPLSQDTQRGQAQTDVTIDLPSAGGSELIRHVTDANFRIAASRDTGMTVLPQEQDNRYTVTMQGDMLFRSDGYQVQTDARVLERQSAELQFVVDIASPDGPAAQVITPRTVQEQLTVDPGMYDATVLVRVDGQAVYREQQQLHLDGQQRQSQGQSPLPQEQEQAVEEQPRPGTGQQMQDGGPPLQEDEQAVEERPDTQVQQRIQTLEQRIAMLEQELQRLRQMQTGGGSPADTDQQVQPNAMNQAGQQTGVTASTAVRDVQSSQPVQDPARGEEEAAVEETQEDRGPMHILISFFQ